MRIAKGKNPFHLSEKGFVFKKTLLLIFDDGLFLGLVDLIFKAREGGKRRELGSPVVIAHVMPFGRYVMGKIYYIFVFVFIIFRHFFFLRTFCVTYKSFKASKLMMKVCGGRLNAHTA